MKKTNYIEELSLLGLGAMRLPENKDGVDYNELNKMIDKAIESGINYFDTSYIYHGGMSEDALRECLVKRYPRESFRLADKLSIWAVKKDETLRDMFNIQLEKCGVDYFDYYLIHSLDEDKKKMVDKLDGFNFVKGLKEEGKAKHIGFSFHGTPELLEEILSQHPEMEFVQLQLNCLDWEQLRSNECYKIARKYNKPITVMEPLKGGALASMPSNIEKMFKDETPDKSVVSWPFRFLGGLEGIMTILSGMSNLKQLEENIEIFNELEPLTESESKTLENALVELAKISSIPCTGCKYCIDCPKGINIPSIFGIYNQLKRNPKNSWNAIMAYRTNVSVKADKCISCKKCQSHCPQSIEIVEELKVCHKVLSQN